jgi:hypothetical protein
LSDGTSASLTPLILGNTSGTNAIQPSLSSQAKVDTERSFVDGHAVVPSVNKIVSSDGRLGIVEVIRKEGATVRDKMDIDASNVVGR